MREFLQDRDPGDEREATFDLEALNQAVEYVKRLQRPGGYGTPPFRHHRPGDGAVYVFDANDALLLVLSEREYDRLNASPTSPEPRP